MQVIREEKEWGGVLRSVRASFFAFVHYVDLFLEFTCFVSYFSRCSLLEWMLVKRRRRMQAGSFLCGQNVFGEIVRHFLVRRLTVTVLCFTKISSRLDVSAVARHLCFSIQIERCQS